MAASTEATPANDASGGSPPRPSNGNTEAKAEATTTTTTTTTNQSLSSDEIALYDRQIRLWGSQAQERIRSANILLISLRALGTEIAKNLTLAGISSLTIVDEEPVKEEDLGSQYFVREEDIGKPRAQAAISRIQELNPRVTVQSGGCIEDLVYKDQTYYSPFDCVIACDHDFMTLALINSTARFAGRPFYAAGVHGFYGYIFTDLVGHEFVVERDKSNVGTSVGAETMTRSVLSVTSKKENDGKNVEIVKKQETYCPLILANSSALPPDVLSNRRKLKAVPALLPCLRALFEFERNYGHVPGHTSQDLSNFTALATTKSRELQLPPETLRADFLRSFIQNIGAEIVPTAAFIGGRLSEDVINVLGKREQPIQNFALFDGDGLEGKIYSLYSTPPELQRLMNKAQFNESLGVEMGQLDDLSQDLGMGMNDEGGGNGSGMMPTDMQMGDGRGTTMGMGAGSGDIAQSMPLGGGAGDKSHNGGGGNVPPNIPTESGGVEGLQNEGSGMPQSMPVDSGFGDGLQKGGAPGTNASNIGTSAGNETVANAPASGNEG